MPILATNWALATRRAEIEAQLVCSCSARNYACVRIVHLDERGLVFCDNCSKSGPVQDFQQEER